MNVIYSSCSIFTALCLSVVCFSLLCTKCNCTYYAADCDTVSSASTAAINSLDSTYAVFEFSGPIMSIIPNLISIQFACDKVRTLPRFNSQTGR